jgi:N6-adenosine-specific RNA methylase IME4
VRKRNKTSRTSTRRLPSKTKLPTPRPANRKHSVPLVSSLAHVKDMQAGGGSAGPRTIEAWSQIIMQLVHTEATTLWELGDQWNAGQKRYGPGTCLQILRAQQGWTDGKYRTCRTAGSLATRFPPLSRYLDIGFSHHQAVQKLQDDLAFKLLGQAVAENWGIKRMRLEADREKTGYHVKTGPSIMTSLTALIKQGDKFNALMADPPWQLLEGPADGSQRGSHGRHYPYMPLSDIMALPVSQVITETTVLFLWCPAVMVPTGLQVMDRWGFGYRTQRVCIKTGEFGTGHYFRMRHELLLLGIRPNTKPFIERPDSVIEAPRGKHSEKPPMHKMIEAACPGPYLELFGRKKVLGWTVTGDQASD